MKRQNVTAYFPIGAGKTAEIHRANADGSISPVVDDIGESGHAPLPGGLTTSRASAVHLVRRAGARLCALM